MDANRKDAFAWIAARSGPVMFYLALTYLVCLAFLIVLWVDVPSLQEKASRMIGRGQVVPELVASANVRGGIERMAIVLIVLIWPVVILESVFHWCTREWDKPTRKYHWFGFLFCLCPALRMCARSPEMHERLWLPGLGWRRPDRRLRRRLERIFSVPMIVIALLILPILVVEFFLKDQVAQYAWLRLLLHIGTGVIWFAFAGEFILMVSVAEKKLAYCKKHWIDLAIILLPFFSFLRSLRIMRASRVARIMMIPQVSKLARVYRLRGTAVKAFQALILLEIFQRLLGSNPERSLSRLRARLEEVEQERKLLKRKIVRLERRKAELEAARNALESADEPIDDNGSSDHLSDDLDREAGSDRDRNQSIATSSSQSSAL